MYAMLFKTLSFFLSNVIRMFQNRIKKNHKSIYVQP